MTVTVEDQFDERRGIRIDQFGDRTRLDDPSFIKDHDLSVERLDFIEVVGRVENANPLVCEVAHDFDQLTSRNLVQSH